MSLSGPILSVEYDENDYLLLAQLSKELGIKNKILFFQDGIELIEYLGATTDQPFLILCNTALPMISGIGVRDYIESSPPLKERAIPFIFFDTSGRVEVVKEAYKSCIQGYFLKPEIYEVLKDRLATIYKYWKSCLHPNNM
ncbi:response regulator [Dyadobacter sediminis]|uniref:Response regulator n=1 Tax=Dyadobacter sediminis TaxID=1493691 RepID=A0A5R9KPZ4_9BACT|nr:response regulator [Dyadobacter sediminis]TLU98355.1 response regulator [Dyadobacter sediminis]GGC14654.1 hypothetical protein GCM10011325_46910 [Dyadobacter sediminis]